MRSSDVARALGVFGIGLGLVEVCAPRALGRAIGLEHRGGLLQLFGLREIASGVTLALSEDPTPWLWTRVMGDGMDAAVLAQGLGEGNPRRGRTLVALLVVSPIVLLDVLYAAKLGED